MVKVHLGKDTIYKRLLKETSLKPIVSYTTRPMRKGESEGVEYHFVSTIADMKKCGKIMESRSYNTKNGIWVYATVDDGQVDLSVGSYLTIGTIQSFIEIREYWSLVPIYIEVDDGLRLERALGRERSERYPKYTEMCRRFLADEVDFSEENIKSLGIDKRFINIDLESCVREIKEYMKGVTECEL